jgi:hypothetical protein
VEVTIISTNPVKGCNRCFDGVLGLAAAFIIILPGGTDRLPSPLGVTTFFFKS